MTNWVEVVRIETEKQGVKKTEIISVNDEYEPIQDMLKHFLKTIQSKGLNLD